MVDELIDIYDENMNFLGQAPIRQAHTEGLWHKSIHCWIIRHAEDNDDKVWLQIRSKNKFNSPKLLDVAAAGHLKAGEDSSVCARKVKEELGLKIENEHLNKLFTAKHVSEKNGYKNYEFNPTYLYETQKTLKDVKLDPSQADGIFEVSLKELKNLFNGKVTQVFTDGYILGENNRKIPHTGSVGIKDFVAHDIKYYQKALQTIENYFDGRKKQH